MSIGTDAGPRMVREIPVPVNSAKRLPWSSFPAVIGTRRRRQMWLVALCLRPGGSDAGLESQVVTPRR